ncbi:MAG: xanthine dehydrogenase family protein subunit M [Pseudomonadales bacterium]|nr:xanthine dehydrogenase family protein subunit M [Pseudomonadales bacterium]
MDYYSPTSIADAIRLLSSPGACVLAGGTDLIPQMQAGRRDPALIIDIKKIPQTRTISQHANRFSIGAAVTGAELSEHPQLHACWPGIVEAFDLIGSSQIQGRATPGGNFCNASPAADSVPAFIAANATCRIVGPQGERECPVEQIIVSPGKTCLQAGEFIVSFMLPETLPYSADAYLRMTPRTEMDIAITGAAVRLTLDKAGVCQTARVVLGAVGPTPLLAEAAAKHLPGSRLEKKTLQLFEEAVREQCRPINDKRGTIEYRTAVAAVLARRSALIAYERALARTEVQQ